MGDEVTLFTQDGSWTQTRRWTGALPWVVVTRFLDGNLILNIQQDRQSIEDLQEFIPLVETNRNAIDVLELDIPNVIADRKAIKNFQLDVPNIQDNLNKAGLELINLAGDKFRFETEYTKRTALNDRLVDASVYIDPDSGIIINRAFSYTDNSFSQASILIDGVDARIDLEVEKIEVLDKKIIASDAAIELQAGEINQRATYSEISTEIAGALAALTPVYSFQFNNNKEEFTGVTYDVKGYISSTENSPAVRSNVDYSIDEYPTFRMLVRLRAGGTWNGLITTALGTVPVTQPSAEDVWEIVTVKATFTGTVTSLSFDLGDVDIDYIEVAKQSANDLALKDLVGRVTTAETNLSAIDGEYITSIITTWYNMGEVINSDVNIQIDSFDTRVGLSATLQALDTEGTIAKASSAQSWVDGANATIRDAVVNYNAEQGITSVTSELDAIRGSITNQSFALGDLGKKYTSFGEAMVDQEYFMHLLRNDLETGDAVIALANTELRAYVDDENTAFAEQTIALIAIGGEDSQASIDILREAVSDDKISQTLINESLKSNIEDEQSSRAASIDSITGTITDDKTAQSFINNSLQSTIEDEASSRDAAIDSVNITIANDKIAQSTINDSLASLIEDEGISRSASIDSISDTISDDKIAQAIISDSLESRIEDEEINRSASIDSVNSTISDDKIAQAVISDNLESRIEDEEKSRSASIDSVNSTISDGKIAQATINDSLQSNIEEEEKSRTASIDSVSGTIADDKIAQATVNDSLQSSIEDEATTRTASIKSINSTITNDKEAQATVSDNLQSIMRRNNDTTAGLELAQIDQEYWAHLIRNDLKTGDAIVALANTQLRTYVNEENIAYAEEVTELVALGGEKTEASIDILTQSIASETTARALELKNYKAEVDTDLGTTLAAAKKFTLATVGYCVVDSGINNDVTEEQCDISGGQWKQLALSEAMDKVSVTVTNEDGSTSTANAGTYFQVLQNAVGELESSAFVGVNDEGEITGLTASDGTSLGSVLTLRGDNIKLAPSDTNARAFVEYDTVNKRAIVRGQLVLEDNTVVTTIEDIRAEDGDTIFEIHQYSPDGSSDFNSDLRFTDYFRQSAIVTNGVASDWSDSVRIRVDGYSPIKGTDYDDGVDGNNVRVEYSVNYDSGINGWSTEFTTGHKYIRTSVDSNGDGNYVPGNAAKFIPEEGIEYTVTDGVSSYLHIKYSDNNANFTSNNGEDLGIYIGTYVDHTLADSDTFGDYKFRKYIGEDGYSPIKGIDYDDGLSGNNVRIEYSADGTSNWSVSFDGTQKYIRSSVDNNGDGNYVGGNAAKFFPEEGIEYTVTNGENGEDGSSSYLHIKYSNDNETFTADNGETLGTFIGTYVDGELNDSDLFSKYKFRKYIGTDGHTPVVGTDFYVQDGSFKSFVFTTSVDQPTGSNLATGGTFDGSDETPPSGWDDGPYFTENQITWVSSALYTHDKVADTWSNAGWSTPAEYSKKGNDGSDGSNGVDGLQGKNGSDGIKGSDGSDGTNGSDGSNGTSSYFHIAYADTASGNGFSQSADSKEYIGTYVDSNLSDAGSGSSKWNWQLVKGSSGSNGSDGLAGNNGSNGETSYLHIAYANNQNGSSGFSKTNSTAKLYIGQYTDFTLADSSDNTKYKWTLIKGANGSDGSDGSNGTNGTNGSDGENNLQYKILVEDGTSIKNGVGSLVLRATSILGSDLSILDSGRIRLVNAATDTDYFYYEKFTADGSSGQDGDHTTAINRSIDVVLKHVDTDFIYDSVTLTDTTDGSGWYTFVDRQGAFPDDSDATQDFLDNIGRPPILDDHLTYVNANNSVSSVKRYTGSGWGEPTLVIHGDSLTKGTVSGDRIVANTEILGPILTGAKLRTSADTSDFRTIIHDDGTYALWIGQGVKNDSNSTFHIKKDGSGFIAGALVQGAVEQVLAGGTTESQFALEYEKSATTATHTSYGNDVIVRAEFRYIANNTNSDSQATPRDFSWEYKKSGVTIESGTESSTVTNERDFENRTWITSERVTINETFLDTTGNTGDEDTYTFEVTGLTAFNNTLLKTVIETKEEKF